MPTRGLRDARCEFTPERIESASCQEGDRTAHTRLRACKCHRSRVPRRRRLDRGSQSRQRFPEVLRHSTRRKPEKPGFASSTNNKTRFCVIRRVERLSRPVKPTYRRADAYSRILTHPHARPDATPIRPRRSGIRRTDRGSFPRPTVPWHVWPTLAALCVRSLCSLCRAPAACCGDPSSRRVQLRIREAARLVGAEPTARLPPSLARLPPSLARLPPSLARLLRLPAPLALYPVLLVRDAPLARAARGARRCVARWSAARPPLGRAVASAAHVARSWERGPPD
jgi:hypothetical protein